jgi:hypothetical protein
MHFPETATFFILCILASLVFHFFQKVFLNIRSVIIFRIIIHQTSVEKRIKSNFDLYYYDYRNSFANHFQFNTHAV